MARTVRKNKSVTLAKLTVGKDRGAGQCRRLEATILDTIPLARAMQLRVLKIDRDSGLHLRAPLDPNINDKGIAFGGAIASLLILAGWGWLQLANQGAGMTRDIVVQRTSALYELPCKGDLSVICPAPYQSGWQRYCTTYAKHKRARLSLQPLLLQADGSVASSMQAEYVATDPDFQDQHV